jgi:para-aminobenzoate synthetase component 1
MVERAIEYIGAGDVFQVNLSHALSVQTGASAGEIYRRLLVRHPTRYAAFLDFGDWAVVSHSPELFLKVVGGGVTTRPIKGTRPHGGEADLLASEKDGAELAMIVDLLRNDLGRVCEMGSVKVINRREIEVHPAVVHAVATIGGKLAAGVGLERLIAATFPCGSVTGAPKIRAMQIIDELEDYRRGVYCGSVGWIGRDERGGLAMELNVAIRTMTVAGGRVMMPVGAGIVADSVPAEEWAETMAKAGAMLGAVGE